MFILDLVRTEDFGFLDQKTLAIIVLSRCHDFLLFVGNTTIIEIEKFQS